MKVDWTGNPQIQFYHSGLLLTNFMQTFELQSYKYLLKLQKFLQVSYKLLMHFLQIPYTHFMKFFLAYYILQRSYKRFMNFIWAFLKKNS